MTLRSSWFVLWAMVLPTMLPAGLRADEKTAVLDTVADEKLLDTRFVRFGPAPTKKLIAREGRAIHFRLPPPKKDDDPSQAGLYSYVKLAGDFEITADFYWKGVPVPKVGYGASVGIAVDATPGTPGGMVSLARATLPKQEAGYLITRSIKEKDGPPRYEPQFFATKAMSGRLLIRREKDELVCMTGDGFKSEMVELARVPYTKATVREVRIYADPGGSDSGLDATITNFRATAEEITGGTPQRDRDPGWGWWPALGVLLVGAGGGGYYWWRQRTLSRG